MAQVIKWECDICKKAFDNREKVRNEMTSRSNGDEPIGYAEICDKCLATVEEAINNLKTK